MATLQAPTALVRETKFYNERCTTNGRDYKRLFRFEEYNVEWLAHHFLPESTETRGGALSPKQQMQLFLRSVSDPGFQTGVGEDIGVHQTTVSKTVKKVRTFILEKASLWIKFPSTSEEFDEKKEIWQRKFMIPCILGAIDCTHVRIEKPGRNRHGDDYINRKRYPSINVQATCDADERFMSVNAQWPGSVHDSRIFKNSEEFHILNKTTDVVLIGDSGYGISPSLITPYKNPVNEHEKYFNKIYAKERVIIERCFGMLKRRFPVLHYKVRVKLENISKTIVSCFVLHNIAKYLNDGEDFEELPELDSDTESDDAPEAEEMTKAETRLRGQEQRDRFAIILYSNRNL